LRRLSDSAFADFNAAEQAATDSGQLPRSKVAADILAQAGVKLKQRMVEALYAEFVPPHVISRAISEHTEFQGLLSRRDKLSKELTETKERRLAVKENTKNHAKRQDARMAVKKISAALRKIDRHIGELKRDIKLQVAQDVRSGVIAVDKSEIIARRMKQPLKMKANSTKLQKKLRPKKRSARRAAARATSASKPGPSASP
jgi:uncharacterized FlaG/YvyC family protein